MQKPLNYYPEKARITISLTLYQTVRHLQVQIKYGFFIRRDNFRFSNWKSCQVVFFISGLTIKCQKRWFNKIQQRTVIPLWDHLKSDEVNFNARFDFKKRDSISERLEVWVDSRRRSISAVSARLKWLKIKQMYVTAVLIKLNLNSEIESRYV